MKYIFCLIMIILLSCSSSHKVDNPNCHKWLLGYTNDNNWTRQGIYCDSLEMLSMTKAYVWVNGRRSTIYAKQLLPMFEPCTDK